MKKALYPGTFDPVTYGHLDLIQRASEVFDEVIVGVAHNTRKTTLFTREERVEMLKKVTANFPKVRVVVFDGLVTNYAKENGVHVLIRGLRAISDYEYELQLALTNRKLCDEIETVFLMPSQNHLFLSSSLVKEAAALGADISSFVPECVEQMFRKKEKE